MRCASFYAGKMIRASLHLWACTCDGGRHSDGPRIVGLMLDIRCVHASQAAAPKDEAGKTFDWWDACRARPRCRDEPWDLTAAGFVFVFIGIDMKCACLFLLNLLWIMNEKAPHCPAPYKGPPIQHICLFCGWCVEAPINSVKHPHVRQFGICRLDYKCVV